MTTDDIHAFGVEIVCKQLQEAEWIVESADVFSDPLTQPQIVAHKDGEIGFFVVRTAMYPDRGRIEGEERQGVPGLHGGTRSTSERQGNPCWR